MERPARGSAPPSRRIGSERGRRRLLLALVAAALTLMLLITGGFWYLTSRYAGHLQHASVFAGLDETKRPAESTSSSGRAPLTFLVVGSDTRSGAAPGQLPDGNSDVMMLARFTGDRQQAQVVSLPRDSWVPIPGRGVAKLNAAYAWGGPSLLIQTVEALTGVRVDHYAAMDFHGFETMTDALGGVDVHLAATVTTGPYTFHQGVNHLDGQHALVYVRQRYGLPGGDFDREKRQQEYLRSMFAKASQGNTLTDVGQLDGFLRALTGAMSVDSGLSQVELLKMAYELRSLRGSGVSFLTAPVAGTGREGQQSVVYLDSVRGAQLWSHLRSDSLGTHLAEFSGEALPTTPN